MPRCCMRIYGKLFPNSAKQGGMNSSLRTCEDVIPPPPSGYDVTYLKSVAGQAKIYVRPLQKDLDLTPTGEVDTVSVENVSIVV